MIWNFLSRFYLRALYLSYHKWYHDGGETDNYTETTLDSGNLTFFFSYLSGTQACAHYLCCLSLRSPACKLEVMGFTHLVHRTRELVDMEAVSTLE